MTNFHTRITILAAAVIVCTCAAFARKSTPLSEYGFDWVLIEEFGFAGAQLPDGSTLIPVDEEYSSVTLYSTRQAPAPFFIVTRNGKKGAHTIDGQLIVYPQYSKLTYGSDGFSGAEKESDASQPLKVYLKADGSAYGDGLPHKYHSQPVISNTGTTNSSRPQRQTPSTQQPATTNTVRKANTTEILSLDNDESAMPTTDSSSANLFPSPLKQGEYAVAGRLGNNGMISREGFLYYNAPTNTIALSIPDYDINLRWDGLTMKQHKAVDSSQVNALVYTNDHGDVLLISETSVYPNSIIFTFNNGDSTTIYVIDRDSYQYMPPSDVMRAIRNR